MESKRIISTPLVSVICITYNQEKFIEQAIKSFIMQKTKFPIEVLIHDDASTDDTPRLIAKYAEQYPDIIKPLYEKENQFSIGNDRFINEMFNQARGKYIAICEGDDFWTDDEKLQRQVDFLETHPDYAICFHKVRIIYENGERADELYPDNMTKGQFTTSTLLKQNFIQSNSVMYRRQQHPINLPAHALPLDWYTHLYYAQFGKIGYIDSVMSAYRRHPGGIWWQTSAGGDVDEVWKRYGINHLILYAEILKMFGDTKKYRNIIDEHICGVVRILHRIDASNKTNLIQTYAEKYMDSGGMFLSLSRSIGEVTDAYEKAMDELSHSSNQLQELNTQLRQQNDDITASLSWRVTKPLRVIKGNMVNKKHE